MQEQQLKDIVEGLDLYIVSHGGVASNSLNSLLRSKGIRCGYTDQDRYEYFCHYPKPLTDKTPCIYLYGDYGRAILSMYRRNLLLINAKKMLGIDLKKKITLEELIRNNPLDPLGILRQKKRFEQGPNVWCLEYPFTTEKLDGIFKQIGLHVDVSTFQTRSRNVMDMSTVPEKDLTFLQYILSVYSVDFL
jgi:hypothetical protein